MGPAQTPFRHEALLYDGADGFVAPTAGFVREGLEAGEAVLVAVLEDRAEALREELGAADAAQVEFLDMAAVGRNPARIIPAWQEWVERNTGQGTAFRGIGEPVWLGRSELEIRECGTHERLLNTAFHDGPGWRLLCPYDAAALPEPVLAAVTASHPVVGGRPVPDGAQPFRAPGAPAAFEAPLPRLGPPLYTAEFKLDMLPRLRSAIKERAERLGLHGRQVLDFVLVADELACNSVQHGGGRGTLDLWALDGHAVCEVRDAGLISDPLAGRRRPRLYPPGGAGLWTANRLCDLVLIHSTPETGTAVRAYLPVA
jgi:anti-sigma regulatory factor (Ser/Thr protein kinase)